MDARSPIQAHLLVVEANAGVQEMLNALFLEEGYCARFVASVEEALPVLDKALFELILLDFFAGRPGASFAEAQLLRHHAYPTPVGLMSTQNLPEEEMRRQGFAFLLYKPFDLEVLLALLDRALQFPRSPEQQRQALVVERYVRANNEQDWETLMSLCAEDLIAYPPANSRFAPASKIVGRAAYLAYLQASARAAPCILQQKALYPDSAGLAMRLTVHQEGSHALIEEFAGAMVFRFTGERICRISATFSAELMDMLTHQSLAS